MANTPTPPDTPDTGGAAGVGEVGVDPKWELPFSPNGLPGEFLYGQPVNEYGGEGFYDHSRPGGDATHPFKVDLFLDPTDNTRKIRVRLGRFYFVPNVVKTGLPETSEEAGAGDDEEAEFFGVGGDDGVPAIAASAVSATSQNHVAKEFLDSSISGYAFLDAPDADEQVHVYLRYLLEWRYTGDPMRQPSEDNRLNIVVVKNSEVSSKALIHPISALSKQTPSGGDSNDRELMRANPSPLVPQTMNDLTLSTSATYFYGMYYLKLATIESPNTPTGLFVDEFIHDDIVFSLTNVAATSSSSGFGAA